MLLVSDLNTWVQSLPPLTALFTPTDTTPPLACSPEPGYMPPEMPGRLVVFTPDGGAATLNERTVDQVTVQMMVRGDQGDPAGTETMVKSIDDTIMGLHPPYLIGGQRCIDLDYLGSPPRWIVRDTARRHHWVVTYVLKIARSAF